MLVPSRAVTDGLRDVGQMTGATGKLCFPLAARSRKIGPKVAILSGIGGISRAVSGVSAGTTMAKC